MEIDDSLRDVWKAIGSSPYGCTFRSFRHFCDWALNLEYTTACRIARLDQTLPYSPNNCIIAKSGMSAAWVAQYIKRWDKAVGVLRAKLGLPPLERR